MLHVTDWLPTLYRAAGGNPKVMKNLDGVDSWESLSNNRKGRRMEVLHNIDPKGQGHSGLRVGDYKILVGDVGMAWDGWYPPWQSPADSVTLHVKNTERLKSEMSGSINNANKLETKNHFEIENFSSLNKQNTVVSKLDLNSLESEMKSYYHNRKPVVVDCGTKPFNASTSCDPRNTPCLFHIPSDPCEYNNIADDNKDLVIQMLVKLQKIQNTMVPPLNGPVDPAGNPKYHNGAWVPWVTL